MRRPAKALLSAVLATSASLLAAGCLGSSSGPSPRQEPIPVDGSPVDEGVRLIDTLTPKLAAASGPFYPDLIVEDSIDLGDGGRMEFAIGLGMRCQGNATSLAPRATGWVTCAVRLAADPSAAATSRRELELGFDYQPLTTRAAAEPVEWRVLVETRPEASGNASGSWSGNLSTVFDSGWRPVDLSPQVKDPVLDLEMVDACDGFDSVEATKPPFDRSGVAILNVSLPRVWHAQVTVSVDLGRSFPKAPGSQPYATPVPGEHNLTARFPVWDSPAAMWLQLPVDLEAEETPGGDGSGPCTPTVAHEVQTWTVRVMSTAADGKSKETVATVDVDVYLSGPLA